MCNTLGPAFICIFLYTCIIVRVIQTIFTKAQVCKQHNAHICFFNRLDIQTQFLKIIRCGSSTVYWCFEKPLSYIVINKQTQERLKSAPSLQGHDPAVRMVRSVLWLTPALCCLSSGKSLTKEF